MEQEQTISEPKQSELEHVCFDLDGVSPWHYESETKTYYRSIVEGGHEAKIKGEYLPDPELLLSTRLKHVFMVKGELANQEDIARNTPSKTTYALWQHWQNVSKNGN